MILDAKYKNKETKKKKKKKKKKKRASQVNCIDSGTVLLQDR